MSITTLERQLKVVCEMFPRGKDAGTSGEKKKKNHSIDPGNVHRGRRQHKDIQGGPGIKGSSCKGF